MVEYREAQLNRVFHALADPTRRRILAQTAKRPQRVTALAESFAMSLNGVSKHIKVLEAAGLLLRRKEGREHHCRMDPRPLAEAEKFIQRHRKFWNQQLDSLEHFLSETKRGKKK